MATQLVLACGWNVSCPVKNREAMPSVSVHYADDDCPKVLSDKILQDTRKVISHHPISVALANLKNTKTGSPPLSPLCRLEKKHMASGSYGEAIEQLTLTQKMDSDQIFENGRSLRKLCDE